ncbi:hypothetical protein ABH892_002171 [Paenibacillus sp. RC254]|uniref:glycosyl hydrolase n=2 Tax=Paenibacillus TaxID=44249 RepID=UPI0024BA3E0E|nr:glycosyl hydrolase [Paenibacillus sp. RC334]
MKKIEDVLAGRQDNYILPFFWQHGEDESTLRDYMEKMQSTGIQAVCVESRPHPDFVGDKWWRDMDIILDEARKRSMKVWILDDSHFPTGYAVGKIKSDFPHLQKSFLKTHQQDFAGPLKHASFLVKWAAPHPGDRIIGVIAAKKQNMDEVDTDTLIDISQYLHDGKVYWDLPEGEWRIFTLVQTFYGGEKETEGYLNPIVPEATQVLIDTVYEAHWQHYEADFGSTIAGFFSDEPRFGNMHGAFGSIGRFDMVLPWRDDMLDLLKPLLSGEVLRLLPLLSVDGGAQAHNVRYAYMNLVSQLYADHFTGKLGGWCRSHGVEYIGHLIEDNNAHARLGYGTGHFYRGLWEQDMSGIDVVLHQIMPGMDRGTFKSFTSKGWDGEFFHYGLAKMGASLGHIDPKKKGRTMCEVYGAYGWGEGLKLMKWITDHMLVRGVNYFVPHAFSPKPFPDPDCPPHFYADGKDPQFRYMHILMQYMNRMSHLLTDGIHIAQAAILYHAEAEWSGDYMLFQKPARELTQHQIEFDIVPADTLVDAIVTDGQLVVNSECFACVVIPYAEALPYSLLTALGDGLDQGLRVFFVGGFPERFSEGSGAETVLDKIRQHKNSRLVSLETIAEKLRDEGIYEINVSDHQPYLRYYHYQQADGDVFMFFNEHPYESMTSSIDIPLSGNVYEYDALTNQLVQLDSGVHPAGTTLSLTLSAYESKVFIFNSRLDEKLVSMSTPKTNLSDATTTIIEGKWKVSLASAEQYPHFGEQIELKELVNLATPDLYPEFVGTMRYQIDFEVTAMPKQARLALGQAYEVAEVWINGHSVGSRICPPYDFDVTKALVPGINTLVIEVTNTLVKEQADFLSQYLLQEPTGLIGPVQLTMQP